MFEENKAAHDVCYILDFLYNTFRLLKGIPIMFSIHKVIYCVSLGYEK
jgi:hypothetical protein